MRIIRAPARVRIVPRVETDARAHAAEILARARAEAEEVLAAAHAQAEELRAQARREGEREANARAAALLAAERARERARDETAVAELALEVARTILGREAESGPGVLRDVVRRALGRLRRARRVVVRVHPDDEEAARALAPAWGAGAGTEIVEVEPDEAVSRGGAVIEADVGRVDARLETQLEALARALIGEGSR